MASAGGVQRDRRIPKWPLVVGAGVLAAAVVVTRIFERGSLPLAVGIDAMAVGLYGVALVTVWFAPRGAGPLIDLLTFARPDVGRLLRADIRRYALLFACPPRYSRETSLAIGSQSMQLLGTSRLQRRR